MNPYDVIPYSAATLALIVKLVIDFRRSRGDQTRRTARPR
jgi:hypothetical protein